ncbi:MAG: DNA adenine methylase [Longimicrobiales bacterium]
MRYIGNKTRLLGFIEDTLRRRGIAPGRALDPFTGTASVARALKRLGHAVVAADVMTYAYAFARAYVQAGAEPRLDALAAQLDTRPLTLGAVVAHLNRLPPRPGFMHTHFTPDGDEGRRHGRMFFTPRNGARIDAVRHSLEVWRREQRIDETTYFLLLATLLEAADRVANTAGVYAACIKSWQPNALRPLHLTPPMIVAGNGCIAKREDALRVVREAGTFDLLYLDPPYNSRQYTGYYHIPELIALGWFDAPPVLRGKTGLLPDRDQRSDWCRRGRCEQALETLLAHANCRHIVMSYNSEGLIPERTIVTALRVWGRAASFRRYRRAYRRYRSDADGVARRYRGDAVEERLYCVSR